MEGEAHEANKVLLRCVLSSWKPNVHINWSRVWTYFGGEFRESSYRRWFITLIQLDRTQLRDMEMLAMLTTASHKAQNAAIYYSNAFLDGQFQVHTEKARRKAMAAVVRAVDLGMKKLADPIRKAVDDYWEVVAILLAERSAWKATAEECKRLYEKVLKEEGVTLGRKKRKSEEANERKKMERLEEKRRKREEEKLVKAKDTETKTLVAVVGKMLDLQYLYLEDQREGRELKRRWLNYEICSLAKRYRQLNAQENRVVETDGHVAVLV